MWIIVHEQNQAARVLYLDAHVTSPPAPWISRSLDLPNPYLPNPYLPNPYLPNT